jgi:spore maturation protein CgeB
MTTMDCPICGKNQYRRLFDIEGGKKKIISCDCGHQSISPFPTEEELRKIYGNEYYDFWGIRDNFQRIFDLKLRTCQKLINQASALIANFNSPRHLDIGCAFGYMIKAGQSSGYDSQGLEISPAADEAIRLGYNVRKASLEDACFTEAYFDLITAVDVIEHIAEPRTWLRECSRVLKEGGILLLVTPDCSSLPAVIRKSKWPHYKVEHLHYYSHRTLKRLLLEVGFDDIRSSAGIRYLTLSYITNHYEKFHPEAPETKALKMLKAISPQKLFDYPLPFPSEMVVIARKK